MKNLDQYKRSIRAISALAVIVCTVLIFLQTWKDFYNYGIVFPFYYKGHLMIAAMYAFFVVLFFTIYGGLKFGYLKCTSIILSQLLAVLCANAITYFEIVLLSARFVPVMPMIYMTLADALVIIVLANVISLIFKKLFPSKQLLLIYEDYAPDSMIKKMHTRNDRFTLKKAVSIKEITLEELGNEIMKYDAVVAYDIHSELRNKIMKLCYSKSVRFYTTPKVSDILVKGSDTIHLFDSPLLLMRNIGLSFEQRIVKRILDIVVSTLVLVITSPILIIISILIKAYDGGPVMFRQDRCTIDGKVFSIHKFRSMIVDAEAAGKAIPATEDDPRVTPIGKFIRKTRIDELPQMIDILQGNMSVVGPRPERVEHVKAYTEDIPEFEYRLKVKGGLTGFAQIYGKYNTTAYDKLKMDLMYIQNYSLRLDIKLIFMTVKIMFMKESTEGFDEEKSKSMSKRD